MQQRGGLDVVGLEEVAVDKVVSGARIDHQECHHPPISGLNPHRDNDMEVWRYRLIGGEE